MARLLRSSEAPPLCFSPYGRRHAAVQQAQLTRDGRVTGGTDTMTCLCHRHAALEDLPADVLLTPGTFDQDIAPGQLLASDLELVGMEA